jgi:hypothetical protein
MKVSNEPVDKKMYYSPHFGPIIFVLTILALCILQEVSAQEECGLVSLSEIGGTDSIVNVVQRQFWGAWGVVDDFILITSRSSVGGVSIVNVSDVTNPNIIPATTAYAPVDKANNAFVLAEEYGIMYVAPTDPSGSMVTVNVTSPVLDNLGVIGTSTFAVGETFDILPFQENGFAVVSSVGGEGLLVVNVSDPTDITLLTQSAESFRGVNVDCADYYDGTQLYCTIASYNERDVYLYNLTDEGASVPAATTIILNTEIDTNRPQGAIFHPVLSIIYIYSWEDMTLQAVNVTDPTNHIVGGFATGVGKRPPIPSRPFVAGDENGFVLFTSYNSIFNAYCILDPMNPTFINSIDMNYGKSVGASLITQLEQNSTTYLFVPKNREGASDPDAFYILNGTFCGDGVISSGEECETGACCNTTTCRFFSNTTICANAPSIFECASDGFCTGSSSTCPGLERKDAGTVCQNSTGPCENAGECDGVSVFCPGTTFKSNLTVCSNSTGLCELDGVCNGTSAQCPARELLPNATICAKSTNPCELDALCDGTSSQCPANPIGPNGIVCGDPIFVESCACINVEQCVNGKCRGKVVNPRPICQQPIS